MIMPRPRKNDPTSLLNPIIEQFAMRIAQTVEQFTVSRIESAVKAQGGGLRGRRGRPASAPRAKRAQVLCYYPGCKNVAAPRFGMFCAAEHKNLSKAEKEKYRALHAKSAGEPAPAKRGRKKKRAAA
jgi:hypothetical protein